MTCIEQNCLSDTCITCNVVIKLPKLVVELDLKGGRGGEGGKLTS